MSKIVTKAQFEAAAAQVRPVANNIWEGVIALKDRWTDEREYEDFADYEKVVKKICANNGLNALKVDKRFKITLDNGLAFSVNFDGWKMAVSK